MSYNILVFPCGSEVGLEMYRSLRYARHVNLIGASSVKDHGFFLYDQYIGNLPFVTDDTFPEKMKAVIDEHQIDAVLPAMDRVIVELKEQEEYLGCKIISSPLETTRICLSKTRTYRELSGNVNVPKVYEGLDDVPEYPVFLKPDVGYGSRGSRKVADREEAAHHLSGIENGLVMEYLPGKEYTIDCFTDRHGEMRYAGARERARVSKGISVNTFPVEDERFQEMALTINDLLDLRGAWFFQAKENKNGDLVLLEVAARLGGSSALYRNKGINFALLSIFDAFDIDVDIVENDYSLELDRAWSNRYRHSISYDTVYVDFDDCLIINNKVNAQLVAFLYECRNREKELVLLTRHDGDIERRLAQYRLDSLFDSVCHIKDETPKSDYIKKSSSILIDDSHAERKECRQTLGIPVFSPDMVEMLLG